MPMNVYGGKSGNFGAGWETHEDWKKYGREPREEYIKNQWHVNQYRGDYVGKKATVKKGHFEHLTVSTYLALPESYLGNYYTKVSTFSQPKREQKCSITACTMYHDCKPRWVRNCVLTQLLADCVVHPFIHSFIFSKKKKKKIILVQIAVNLELECEAGI